jgi:hypothetical protein
MKSLVINFEPSIKLINFLDNHFANRWVCDCGAAHEEQTPHGCGYEYIGRRCEYDVVIINDDDIIDNIVNASIRGEYNVVVVKRGDIAGEIIEKQLAIPVLIWD